jgi:hypothetical protein
MNPIPPPLPSDFVEFSMDSTDISISFIDCSANNTWRPRRRDIRGVPPGAFDLPAAPEEPKKEPTDDPQDTP